jgi:hypothetical protein
VCLSSSSFPRRGCCPPQDLSSTTTAFGFSWPPGLVGVGWLAAT